MCSGSLTSSSTNRSVPNVRQSKDIFYLLFFVFCKSIYRPFSVFSIKPLGQNNLVTKIFMKRQEWAFSTSSSNDLPVCKRGTQNAMRAHICSQTTLQPSPIRLAYHWRWQLPFKCRHQCELLGELLTC